jgi:hypothetical protein
MNNIANVSRFCMNTNNGANYDANDLLAKAERNNVMLFLEWILDNYSSRKRTSLRQKFKHWRQLYRKIVDRRWRDDWREEINDVNFPKFYAEWKRCADTCVVYQ